MDVEIVDDHPNHQRIWKAYIHQVFHLIGEVNLGAPLCHLDVPPSQKGLEADKQVAGAFTFVFKIIPHGLSRLCR